eukprot:CAMPEP_0176069498 /NCGR_PEP_ID=MMETSP0120_2-20121206/34701_1 /TAXON_ID=160619 /ORGANISM="Kryptoperidinium foliaceum, Strain CCMP 1326" /LENGTH=135 /DNA_ID=CAMNT_0017403135 /DNA_START=149 /DNA_END=553 /DNA_ORIENTATION=-
MANLFFPMATGFFALSFFSFAAGSAFVSESLSSAQFARAGFEDAGDTEAFPCTCWAAAAGLPDFPFFATGAGSGTTSSSASATSSACSSSSSTSSSLSESSSRSAAKRFFFVAGAMPPRGLWELEATSGKYHGLV